MIDGARVAQATWISIAVVLTIALVFWLTGSPVEGGEVRWRAAVRWFINRYFKSSATGGNANDSPEEPPSVPETNAEIADTDAVRADTTERTGTPVVRISRHMSDAEIIALLAVQRTPDGKHRFSANAIAALVGGTRAKVLDQVSALRSIPPEPEYRPLDADARPVGLPAQQPTPEPGPA